MCQRLLLLEVRHRLITALNNLLRPSRTLESAAPTLWRRYMSREGDQHKVLQVSLSGINIRNVCTDSLVPHGGDGNVGEMSETMVIQSA